MDEMTKKVREILKKEGLMPTKCDLGLNFKFQMLDYAFRRDEDDNQFITFVIPGIFDVKKEQIVEAFYAINTINTSIKYVKAVVFNAEIWLTFEHYYDEAVDLKDLVMTAIAALYAAYHKFATLLEDEDESPQSDEYPALPSDTVAC